MNDKTACTEDERLVALVGLAAGKPEPSDACPPPETLSAFIEGHLPAHQRQEVVTHLNRCEQCYQEWLDVALTLEETLPGKSPAPKRPWWHRLTKLFQASPWMLPLGAAVAMTIAVIMVVPHQPAQEGFQASQLAAVIMNHPETRQALRQLPHPSKPALAFGDSSQEPVKQAFTAGFRDALRLSDTSFSGNVQESDTAQPHSWPLTPWRDYYQLGQWTLLTWMLTQAERVSGAEWQIFDLHCMDFIERFEQKPGEPAARQIAVTLREIHALLSDLARSGDPAVQARLGRKLNLTLLQWLV